MFSESAFEPGSSIQSGAGLHSRILAYLHYTGSMSVYSMHSLFRSADISLPISSATHPSWGHRSIALISQSRRIGWADSPLRDARLNVRCDLSPTGRDRSLLRIGHGTAPGRWLNERRLYRSEHLSHRSIYGFTRRRAPPRLTKSSCERSLAIAVPARASSSGERPARTRSTIWRRNSGGYAALVLPIVDSSNQK